MEELRDLAVEIAKNAGSLLMQRPERLDISTKSSDIDIVTQIAAVRAALRRVEEEILRDHVAHCVNHAIASGNKMDRQQKIEELMAVVSRSDR